MLEMNEVVTSFLQSLKIFYSLSPLRQSSTGVLHTNR